MVEVGKFDSKASEYSDLDEQKLMRKIDLNIVPILTLLYLLSFIDRANIVSLFERDCYSRTNANIAPNSREMQKSKDLIQR